MIPTGTFKTGLEFPATMIVGRIEFLHHKAKFLKQIREGAVFIYPTDTVYAIGCDARNNHSVSRVRQIKNRNVMPISIVAPNTDWIRDHCVSDEEWLARLPGPYTLAFLLKDERCIAPAVTMGRDTLGVRIPSHWIHDVVAELGFPIIGTSANKTGQNVMTRLDDLPTEIIRAVDFIIYEGEHRGHQAELVDLTGKGKPKNDHQPMA